VTYLGKRKKEDLQLPKGKKSEVSWRTKRERVRTNQGKDFTGLRLFSMHRKKRFLAVLPEEKIQGVLREKGKASFEGEREIITLPKESEMQDEEGKGKFLKRGEF